MDFLFISNPIMFIIVLLCGMRFSFSRLFERCIALNVSPKNMKFFFKRYLQYEKDHGTEASTDAVKQKAREYVASKAAV